jgi:hypothetical protein
MKPRVRSQGSPHGGCGPRGAMFLRVLRFRPLGSALPHTISPRHHDDDDDGLIVVVILRSWFSYEYEQSCVSWPTRLRDCKLIPGVTEVCWDAARRWLVNCIRRFGTTHQAHLQESQSEGSRHQRFGETCCNHLQNRIYHFSPKDEDTSFLLNVGADLPNYTASRPRNLCP